jgi:hypothetical protein
MTTITNIEAGRIVDWLHEDDTLISTDSRRFILRDGWTVAVDLSTVALFHYSQPVNPGGYAPEIYEAVSMVRQARMRRGVRRRPPVTPRRC